MSTNNIIKKTSFAPRFFVFLVIAIMLFAWAIYGISNLIAPSVVEWGRLNSSFSAEAVIVRNENVVSSTDYGRLECLIAEGEYVYAGTSVASLYLSDYSEIDIANLISIQQEIKDYQTSNILKNIINTDLDEIEDNIDRLISEISELARENRQREIPAKERELKIYMEQRRRYMNENLLVDSALEKLFQQEVVLTEKINNNKVTMFATNDGIVSFFLDGMETTLNYELLQVMTNNEYEFMKEQITEKYDELSFGENSKISVNQPIYRLVDPNTWYAVMRIPRNQNTMKSGEEYIVNFDGYNNGSIFGYVEFLRDAGRDVLVIMRFTDDIGTMSTLRTVICNIGDNIEGYKISREYIQFKNEVYGITVRENGQKTFIPINILAQDATHVIISSADENNPVVVDKRLVKSY